MALIVGGLVLMVVDRLPLEVKHRDAMAFPLPMYFGIGVMQCLAVIPGVSRSGATIVGAMLMGADKRSAAEFSFFLAMPTMAGAFAYDLVSNYRNLSFSDGALIVIGFRRRLLLGPVRRAPPARLRVAPGLRAARLVAPGGRRRRALPASSLWLSAASGRAQAGLGSRAGLARSSGSPRSSCRGSGTGR